MTQSVASYFILAGMTLDSDTLTSNLPTRGLIKERHLETEGLMSPKGSVNCHKTCLI
jgi:hypothetical protein